MAYKAFIAFLGVVVLVGGLSIAVVVGQAAQRYPNTCQGWAQMLGKEGKVRDSITMHMLGCDDSPYANTHYRASGGKCEAVARKFARQGLYAYPRTVAAQVEETTGCTVFEDGAYAPPID